MSHGHVCVASLLAVVFSSVTLGGCWASDLSGQYVAKFTNGVYWLQVVQTSDGHVTGQLETHIVGADGKIDHQQMAVSGATNGDTVTMSFKPISFLPFTVAASGDRKGGKLTLNGTFTGGQPTIVVFVKSDLSEYNALVNEANARSKGILAAKAAADAREAAAKKERDFVTGLDKLVERMERFASVADERMKKLAAAEQRYQSITHNMQRLSNMPDGRQAAAALRQGSHTTDQIHGEILAAQKDFQGKTQSLTRQVAESKQACQGARRPSADKPVLSQDQERNAACLRLLDAEGAYRQKLDSVSGLFVRLEGAYQQERRSQDQLVRSFQ